MPVIFHFRDITRYLFKKQMSPVATESKTAIFCIKVTVKVTLVKFLKSFNSWVSMVITKSLSLVVKKEWPWNDDGSFYYEERHSYRSKSRSPEFYSGEYKPFYIMSVTVQWSKLTKFPNIKWQCRIIVKCRARNSCLQTRKMRVEIQLCELKI